MESEMGAECLAQSQATIAKAYYRRSCVPQKYQVSGIWTIFSAVFWKDLKKCMGLFGKKKLKKIPYDVVSYVLIEAEAIKDANDKQMISSYCLG